MRYRGLFRTSDLNRWGLFALIGGLIIAFVIGLNACRSDRVTVNPKDPRSPKYAYRLDQLALLQMASDDIMNLERKKAYDTIYDEYTSRDFQKNVSRRRFLIMSNCVETYLGGLQEFDVNDLSFNRQRLSGQAKAFDVLTRKVQRERGTLDEQLVFIPSGFNFRLNGMYWISKDKVFLQCIANSAQIEANTAPMPEALPTSEEAQKTPEGQTPSAGTQPVPTPTGEQAPVPTGSQPAPTEQQQPMAEPLPVPAQPIPVGEPSNHGQPRPAGAGAVMDTRPTQEQEKPPTPPASEPSNTLPKTQGRARNPNRIAMPLEPSDATATNR